MTARHEHDSRPSRPRLWRPVVLLCLCAAAATPRPASAVDAVLVGIHCDPVAGGGPQEVGMDGLNNWDRLVTIIDDQATPNGVRVTIQLAENWVRYVLEDIARVATLQQWVWQGHQIAFHHHDITHAGQPFFDNCAVPPDQWTMVYQGHESWEEACLAVYDRDLASDLLCILQARLRSGPFALPIDDAFDLNLASHGTDADLRAAEWQPGALYSASRAIDDNAPLTAYHNGSLARSSCEIYAGRIVPQAGSNPYVTVVSNGPSAVDVRNDILLTSWEAGDYVSVTFHPHEYQLPTDRQQIDLLFQTIATNYGPNELASEILDTEKCINELRGAVDRDVIRRTRLHRGDWCACPE